GAVTHPDLVNADMGLLRHITRLARQQQKHAHGLAVGLRRDAAAIAAFHTVIQHGDADRSEQAQSAEAAAEGDGIVHRTAARIQHDGRSCKVAAAGKLLESFRTVGGDDTDRADPAAATGSAGHPAKLHRQLACFERVASTRGAAEGCGCARQCEREGGGAKQCPAAEIMPRKAPQTGSFPKPQESDKPKRATKDNGRANPTPKTNLSYRRHKMVSG